MECEQHWPAFHAREKLPCPTARQAASQLTHGDSGAQSRPHFTHMVDHPGVHLVKFTQVACQQIPRILTGVQPEPSHLRGGMLSTFFQRLWFCWGRGWEPYLIEQYARVGELMSSVLGGQHPIHIQSRFQIGHIGKRATKWVVLMDITGKGRG